ncbi:Hypothetical predicted protein [Mytilus galloprovincialis]|uniref:B box-type domain-containing protein n=2 Tax=Mytilus galloprovincialis TaxID=29158 RepID=A0A8B6F3M3_MYTGA|nr:Hypothetical predicted protein [Mytilus galloprovincialis]
MASSTHICGICDLRNISKPSKIWCSECDEGLCNACQEHHSLSKATRQHSIIPIAEYSNLPSDIMQISQSCCKHDEKLILYCKDHENPCCGKCAVESHKQCKEIVSLDEIIKNAKTSVSFHETEATLIELIDNISKIRNAHKENLTDVSKKRKAIELEIKKTRLRIDKHLNKMQKTLTDEIHGVCDKESEKLRLSIKTLDGTEHVLSEYQMKIVNIKKYASDIQAFMAIKKIETDVEKEEEYFLSYIPEGKMNIVTINCKIAKPIQAFLNQTNTFGDVGIETTTRSFALSHKKSMQAQMMLPKVHTIAIENITALLHKRVNTVSYNVRGCCILPNENMVFACFDQNTLTFMRSNGSKDATIRLPAAVDLAYLEADKSIAVTSSTETEKCIRIIDLQNKKTKKNILVNTKNFGIAAFHDSLVYCTNSNNIRMISLRDELVKNIVYAEISPFAYVETFQDLIYYTNTKTDDVTCCDMKGIVKWRFKFENVDLIPYGITIDNTGNVYVTTGSNNVIVISPDGKRYKELLSSRDGLRNPIALYYDRKTNTLLVSNRSKDAVVYDIVR